MNTTSHLPPACTVTTKLGQDVSISVKAEAVSKEKQTREVQANWNKDFPTTRQDRDGLLACVSMARFILCEDLVPYSTVFCFEIKLERNGQGVPWQDIARLNAILADHALRGLWPATNTRTLAGCRLEGERIEILPLPLDLQRVGLELIKDAASLPVDVTCLLLPATQDAEARVLHEAIRTHRRDLNILDGRTLVRSKGVNQRSATVHFPVIEKKGSGDDDRLLALSVLVRGAAAGEDAALEFAGLNDKAEQDHIRALLEAVRAADNPAGLRWRTRVHLPANGYQGRSYELALVVADRMARGRDFGWPHGKRLIATGALTPNGATPAATCEAGALGSVLLPTTTLPEKCRLFEREAKPGERILVPGNWRIQAELVRCSDTLRQRGASVACVDNVLT